jgi:hypothetical protein
MKALLSILAVMVTTVLFGQQTFSNNREKFVKEFQKALSDYGKGEFHDFAKKDLPKILLETSDFPENYFSKMVETCNLMQTKNLKPYPELYQYVFSVYSLVVGKQSAASFTAWHNSVDKMLDSRNIKKFEDFIELSAGFFSEGKIAESSNFKWFYIGGEYSFEFTDKPFIKLSKGNLVCRVDNKKADSRKDQKYLDSVVVNQTSGTYDPVLKKWEGEGGTLNWMKVGIPKNETFATLGKFNVSCKTPNLTVDTVMLTTKYFSKPIMGSLSDRAFIINREEDKIYPQFLSFEKRLRIKNLREGIDYDGGFAMEGGSFVGRGTQKEPARIIVYRNNQPFIKASAQQISVSQKKIFAINCATALYMNTGDSITHAGLEFAYDFEKNMVEMTRSRIGIGQAPFQDSYHMLDIYVAKIAWNTTEQDILFTYDFGTSQEQRIARFESRNYFDARLYEQLLGLEAVHPLVAIHKYCYKYDEYILPEGKVATALNKTIEQAKPLLLELSNYGFISYDTESKMITVNPKLENFVLGKAGKRDYDNIIFTSDLRPKELKGYTEEQIKEDKNLQRIQAEYKAQSEERRLMRHFGRMNLGTLEIQLNAVDYVKISEIQNTTVFPEGSQVVIKENRNFEFRGWLNAGKMEVNTLSANYNYAEHKFNLLSTDETILRVAPLNPETDGKRPIPMFSSIRGIKGELFVDDITNRSGQNAKITDFPKVKVTKPTYVFYNMPQLYRGAYDSTRFYYTVDPFDMDSLDNFSEKFFRLKGELTSAGIFPKIREDLKIMPDYSFGFSTAAPKDGYEFYGVGAKYNDKIILSNNGLQGAGTINFVQSVSVSKALTFLPDSTIGFAVFKNNPVESGIEFPDVESEDAFITYLPKNSMLKARSTPKTDLKFFKGEAKMRGTAIVTPAGMRGNGLMTFKTATTVSKNYRFKRWDIDADTSGFSLKNTYAEQGEDPLAFQADNVQAHISFKDRMGEFVSNKGSSQVNFPVNQYICRMDKFSWFMDYAELQLEKTGEKDITIDTDMDLVGPNFFSVHPKQDSLQFRSPKAKYDLKARSIFCEGVEYIEVADARIYPDSLKVVIRKNAKMDQLNNSKVVANYLTKYHTFIRSTINITARRAYQGNGEYPYYDKDSTLTYFKMTKIGLDTSYQTVATGAIADNEGFKLSKEFDYYGKVSVKAASPELFFDGATRINHTCEKFERNWLSFSAAIDPKNIQIPVASSMKNLNGESISAGIVWRHSNSLDSIRLYPTFLSSLESKDDITSMTASGFLQYNMNAKEFQIGSKEKLLNRSEKGNFLALHTESCSLHGEGVVDLGLDLGDVAVDAVGIVDYNQSTGQTTMNLTTRYRMPVDKSAMQGITEKILKVEELIPMDMDRTTLEMALVEWTDLKTADRFKSDYTIKGEIKKMPNVMEESMIFTGVKLVSFDKTSMEEKGLISNAPTAVLVNMYEKPVLKQVPFKCFFQQMGPLSGGDKFNLLIDIPGGLEYYFDYTQVKKDGTLRIISGDETFTSAVNGIKEDKRKIKNFRYEITTQRVYLSKFMNLFER